MRTFPAGTISFLFSDIEGSTRLLQRLGEAYPDVLAAHNRIIHAATERAGGVEVKTTGDGFFLAFPFAAQALDAAVSIQRSLAAHEWPRGGTIRVRMGLHAGTAMIAGNDYIGLDVHRAARIAAAGHGGQILMSDPFHALVHQHLPHGVALQDLGQHWLKDLEAPEHLFQAIIPGLLRDFPPVRSVNVRPHNLPSEVTDFIGREQELKAVEQLLSETRLLTLTGPGGTGKTRLALHVAANVLPTFADGVFFVPLASIHDPELVASTIGKTLGISEEGRLILDILKESLATKKLLLVLDNLEHVLIAVPQIGALLAAAPGLKVLATSRTRLRLRGEQVFEVPPLAVPGRNGRADLHRLASMDSITLFVRRAREADPNFMLTVENAPAVAQIVNGLEGIPLAIELAAVHSRLFPPAVLAQRLKETFTVLRGGPQDLPARHRALRDTIAWSYQLLAPPDRAAFRRLGIFTGGFAFEAAEIVVTGDPVVDVVDSLTSLLDQSLLQRRVQHGDMRLSMLETIREFARAELQAAGEAQALARRHAAFFLTIAEQSEHSLTGHQHVATIDRLSADQDNIRAALRFCLESGDIETGLRIGGAVWRFWHATGQIREARRWLEQLLARYEGDPGVRAKGLVGLAGLAYWQADYQQALDRYHEALEIYRGLGDKPNEADTLLSMSTTSTWSADMETGSHLADQALAMFEALGRRDKVGMALMAKGFARWMVGDLEQARPLWEESLAIAIEVGDEVEAATKRLALASMMFQQGEREQALRSALAALDELVRLKNVTFTIMAVDWVAALAAQEDARGTVRLAGAAAALRATVGGGMRPEESGLASVRETAAQHLDAETIDRLWVEGQEWRLDQVVAYARDVGGAVLSSGRSGEGSGA